MRKIELAEVTAEIIKKGDRSTMGSVCRLFIPGDGGTPFEVVESRPGWMMPDDALIVYTRDCVGLIIRAFGEWSTWPAWGLLSAEMDAVGPDFLKPEDANRLAAIATKIDDEQKRAHGDSRVVGFVAAFAVDVTRPIYRADDEEDDVTFTLLGRVDLSRVGEVLLG